MESTNTKNLAAVIHLSALSQYLIPLGNYILPVVLWSTTKDRAPYLDRQGKNAINFQLSLFLYSLILALIAIPIFIYTVFHNVTTQAFFVDGSWEFSDLSLSNLTGIAALGIAAVVVFCTLKVAEFFLVIYAAVKSANGDEFQYPLSIKFIK